MALPNPPAIPQGALVNSDGTPTHAFMNYMADLDLWTKNVNTFVASFRAVWATYATPTGAFDKTTFNTGTVGTTVLAQHVAPMISDLKGL